MAKKGKEPAEEKPKELGITKILPINITDEMRKSFIGYAMSVITSRALPDVRDGLKPVHRRILFAMRGMGLYSNAKFRKSAAVVGEVLGKFHPHGDMAVYDSMVHMAQNFNYRYPLVHGQGNFGSVDGDGAAAPRYTEAKMAKLAEELLRDIEKETVDFRPNYDGRQLEPIVLPAQLPNLLLNGVLGIAVGMATNIPPHNLGEVVDATLLIIDNPKSTNEDLLQIIQGPDFPLGAVAYNKKDIAQAYATGRGGVVVRGEAEIVEGTSGRVKIIITSIPFRVNRSKLLVDIADLVRDKKIIGIKDLRDESTVDTRIVVFLKTGVNPQRILKYLYKHTDLESAFNYNMTALVKGVPQLLSLKDILENFVEHRKEVVTRRTQYELKKALERAHILEGLKLALDHIDEVIRIIRASKDGVEAKANLIKKFKFSDIQAQAILDMRLQKLAGLERKAVLDELKEKLAIIKELKAILASEKRILEIVGNELKYLKEKFADKRRTRIVKGGVKEITEEDLIPEKDSVLVFTSGGYVKRTDPGEYKAQHRGGVGVSDMSTKDEDIINHVLLAHDHCAVLFFTNKGRVYSIKMYEIAEAHRQAQGKSIRNYLSLQGDEFVSSILALPRDMKNIKKDASLVMITKFGTIKRVDIKSFESVRVSGILAINLKDNDQLLSVKYVDTESSIVLVTKDGQAIRFDQDDARIMGRIAGGVRAIKLRTGDEVVGAGIVEDSSSKKAQLLVVTEKGFGKRTKIGEYKVQSRGGSGIKTSLISEKTGKVVSARVIISDKEELIAISKKSQIIRMAVGEISILGRATQGVKIMKIKPDDAIASFTVFGSEEKEVGSGSTSE